MTGLIIAILVVLAMNFILNVFGHWKTNRLNKALVVRNLKAIDEEQVRAARFEKLYQAELQDLKMMVKGNILLENLIKDLEELMSKPPKSEESDLVKRWKYVN